MTKENKLAAVFLSAAVALLIIGLLNIASEMSKPIKDALTLHKGIGPYSGKVLFGYLGGLIAVAPVYFILRYIQFKLIIAFAILVISLFISTLFVFTPFIHFIVG